MSDGQEETGDIFAEFYSMVSHLPNFHHHVQYFVLCDPVQAILL